MAARLGQSFERGFRYLILILFFVLYSLPIRAQLNRDMVATDVFNRRDVNGQAVYFADQLNLPANQRVVFDEPAKVYVNALNMDQFSSLDTQGNNMDLYVQDSSGSNLGIINVSGEMCNPVCDTSGQDGQNGVDGKKALDGLKGTDGASGSDASDASNGADGGQIFIVTPHLNGNLVLITKGGNGGHGGNGGDGGHGGDGLSGMDARVLYNFQGLNNLPVDALLQIGAEIGVPVVGQVLAIMQIFNGVTIGDGFDGFDGGNGGDAGRGGNGGNGGKGGDIDLLFGTMDPNAGIYTATNGGAGGAGGSAGVPGVGGSGGAGGKAGDIWARDGKPGNPGKVGAKALAGLPGQAGQSGNIHIMKTGDDKWVGCYIEYQRDLDIQMGHSLADRLLEICMGQNS